MLRGVFVTGTDTGVGKTVVSAALLHRFRGTPGIRYWKPVQTGIEADDDTAEVLRLAGAASAQALREGVRLPRPLSPHLSASLAGTSISLPPLMDLAWAQPDGDRWIVEGAGGVLVPLNDRELMVDLISVLGLPAVIAARSGLGTINHTLLTIEALRARAIPIAGVVMVGARNPDNRVAIETRGHVPVIGELPRLEPFTPEALQQAAEGIARGGELDALLGG
ncbi:MAG: dethiobiotin synthase [Acidobacteria bacterium]|nr:dethiobiotin synthase [Acidobacteriota bacterium]